MAQNNQRDPNLRAATVARVNQLLKTGLTKAGAFDKISAETGRAKDAVQMLYYRAVRATAAASKSAAKPAAAKAAPVKPAEVKAAPVKTATTKSARSRPATKPFAAKPVTATPAVAVAVPKAPSAPVATPAAAPAPKSSSRRSRRARRAAAARARARRAGASAASRPVGVAQSGDFPALLNGIATAINALLKHVEKTVEENKTLKEQGERLKAITSLIRGR